jgi:CrcB protein
VIAWIGIGLLGGLGAVARYVVTVAVASRVGRPWPYGTLAVNVSGAFALGVLAGAAVHGDAYLLAGTGFIGAYTTFSTWMVETERLAAEGRRVAAFANIAVSLALGLGAAAVGHGMGAAL